MRFGNSGGIYRDIMKFSILWSKKSLVFHFILKFLIQNKTILFDESILIIENFVIHIL